MGIGEVHFSPALLMRLAKGTFRVVENPIPDDARVVYIKINRRRDVVIHFASEHVEDDAVLDPPVIETVDE